MRIIFFLLFLVMAFCGRAQRTLLMELGDSVITIESDYPPFNYKKAVLFINVHENEATSVRALRAFDPDGNYPFVWLHHHGTRRIFFNDDTLVFSVDPNRIFSKEGIVATLAQDSVSNRKAEKMAKSMAHEILKHVHYAGWVISLHNNTPDNYSILSYLPEQPEAANTKEVFVNPAMDPDDFIYTTNLDLFNALKAENINVILQDNDHCVNDGSLSVYCGIKGIPYANVEAEEGHVTEQTALIAAVVKAIKSMKE